MPKATTQSFLTSHKGGKILLQNPLTGQMEEFTSKEAAHKRKIVLLEAINAKLGRPATVQELSFSRATVADDRTNVEQVRDSNFTPVLKVTTGRYDSMLDGIDKEIENERISKLTPLERRRHDVQTLIDRETEGKLAEKEKAAHLEKVGPRLDVINRLINEENWNPHASERLRAQLRKAKQQIEHPDHDPVTALELTRSIDATLAERRAANQAALDQEAIEVGRKISEFEAASTVAANLSEETIEGGENSVSIPTE